MLKKLPFLIQLIRLDRPIGIYLLLWPTLWSLWIASHGIPELGILTVFVLGVILMRSAGCAINDYADRHIDQHIARTRNRPLVTGKITAKEALAVFVILSLLAFLLVLQLNLSYDITVGGCGHIGSELPLYETLSFFTATAFRRGFCMGDSDGIYGGD